MAPLMGAALLLALVLGPWLARTSVRLAARDDSARPGLAQSAGVTLAFALLSAGAVLRTGARRATVGLVWVAGAGVVLAAVDLASHRLPDRVTYPAAAV